MNTSNKFIINMKKDIGRRLNISNLCSKINAVLWEGIDSTKIDSNGYAIEFQNEIDSTNSAKKSKLNLFNYFLKYNKTHQFLWMFEDDIYLHKNFYDHINEIDKFLHQNNPYLLYLGVSNNVIFNETGFVIENLNKIKIIKPEPCSGAYAVVINRAILPTLISYIKNPSFNGYPFDNSCLGRIQLNYQDRCYISNYPLVVPDVTFSNIRKNYDQSIYWKNCCLNKTNYVFPQFYYLFCIISNSIVRDDIIKNFKNIFKSFCPYYRIVYIVNNCDNIILNEYYDYIVTNNVQDSITARLKEEKYNSYYLKVNVGFKLKYYDCEKIIQCVGTHYNKNLKITYDMVDFIEVIVNHNDVKNDVIVQL